MKTKSYRPQNVICSSAEASEIFLKNSGKTVSFKPYIINFHSNCEIISSICWKGYDKKEKKDAVVSALKVPREIINNFSKTDYTPLNKGDTLIINGKILTVEENNSEFMIMELPYISSEKEALNMARTVTGTDSSDLFWHLATGLNGSTPVCHVWVGLCIESADKSIIFPVFAKDKELLGLINDIEPIITHSHIMIDSGIYYYHYDDEDFASLDFLCTTPQGLPC